MRLRNLLAFSAFSAGIGLGIFSFLKPNRMNDLFTHTSYYWILLLFCLWLTQLIIWVKSHQEKLKESLTQNRFGIFLALILTILILVSTPTYFRILSDETNLLAVSKSMTYTRTVENVTMGKWYYYNFYPFNQEFEKRPLLFPFFLHLLHSVFGYRPENAFILNGLILFSLLSMIFVWIKESHGRWAAALTLIFAVSQPVLSQTAASAGFDLLFVLFFFLSLFTLSDFLKKPSTQTFQWLWMNLLMLAHTRHEAPIACIIIFLAVFFLGYLKTSFFSPYWYFVFTPLMILPRLWQHWLRIHIADPFETPDGVPAFSLHHLLHHNKVFLKSLVDFNFMMPYATALNLIGVMGIFYFLIRLSLQRISLRKDQKHFIGIAFLCLAGLWCLLNSFHIGDLSHPASARYYVIFYLVISFVAALFLMSLASGREWIFGLGAASFLLYHPLSIENRFSNQLLLPREYRTTMDFFKKLGNKNILIIADRPGQYTVSNYGAVNFEYANENKEDLLTELERHLFRDIYVIQEIEYETHTANKDTFLDPSFNLQIELEFQNKAESFIRISKVKR